MLHTSDARRSPQWLLLAVPFALAALAGAIVPLYVDSMGESVAKLAALPALILLGALFFYSRNVLLLLMMVIRGATETLFESTRISLGGAQLGVGGLMNMFAILIAVVLIAERPRLFGETIPNLWAAFLVVMLTFGIAGAPSTGEAIRLTLVMLSNAAVFIGAYQFTRDPKHFAICVRLVIVSSVVPSLYALYQIATGGGYNTEDAGLRLNSTFSHPNTYAFYLTLVISFVFYTLKSRLFKPSMIGKAALCSYLLLLIAFLFLTKTRSAWAACAALFFAYAIFFEKRYFVYLTLGAIVAMLVPEVRDRLLDLTVGNKQAISSYDSLNSFAWRVSLWESALAAMSPLRYLTGTGLGSFVVNSPQFFKEGGGINWGAHSVFVQLIYELGIPGLLAFVWIFVRLFAYFTAWLKIDRLAGFILMALVVEYLTIAYSDNMLDYLSFNWYLWFMFGSGLAIAVAARRSQTAAEPAAPSHTVAA